ncbi:MAG: archease [Methanohalobium sp.]|uniref:archease n=1 Tax=Methanohalobium sp. TaxID=2837493 RepID=UPI00397A42DE
MSHHGNQRYEFLEHTADAQFRAYGNTLEEAFENAALAMFNVMVNTGNVSDIISESIDIESPDLDTLLVDWLSELLYLFDVNQVVYSKFDVDSIKKQGNKYLLSARIFGEILDLEKHEVDTEVKAVTYNQLEVKEGPNGWTLQVLVDI